YFERRLVSSAARNLRSRTGYSTESPLTHDRILRTRKRKRRSLPRTQPQPVLRLLPSWRTRQLYPLCSMLKSLSRDGLNAYSPDVFVGFLVLSAKHAFS